MHILFLRLKPEFSWNCKFLPKKTRFTTFFSLNSLLSPQQRRENTGKNLREIQKAIKRIKTCLKFTVKLHVQFCPRNFTLNIIIQWCGIGVGVGREVWQTHPSVIRGPQSSVSTHIIWIVGVLVTVHLPPCFPYLFTCVYPEPLSTEPAKKGKREFNFFI